MVDITRLTVLLLHDVSVGIKHAIVFVSARCVVLWINAKLSNCNPLDQSGLYVACGSRE